MTLTLTGAELSARMAAEQAATAAGGAVQHLETLAAVRAAESLFGEVWRCPAKPPFTADVMRAVEHAGGYVVGVYEGSELLGASCGFVAIGAEGRARLHSHISGVQPKAQGRGLGWLLKMHQRAWALERGIETITWTFDPVVRRNAWFNLGKLGAHGVEYLVDFYGPMKDGLNSGQPTDRLFVEWDLLSPEAVAAADGQSPLRTSSSGALVLDDRDGWPWPVACAPASTPVLIRLPFDIEQLRSDIPEAARAWRVAVRDALQPLLDAGRRATGFTRDGYLIISP
jgi:predicted GNAT superfamily acetyltransferase